MMLHVFKEDVQGNYLYKKKIQVHHVRDKNSELI